MVTSSRPPDAWALPQEQLATGALLPRPVGPAQAPCSVPGCPKAGMRGSGPGRPTPTWGTLPHQQGCEQRPSGGPIRVQNKKSKAACLRAPRPSSGAGMRGPSVDGTSDEARLLCPWPLAGLEV